MMSAAGLLIGLVVALLGGWFVSGWRAMQARQHEIREVPRGAAAERASELARDLQGELEAVVAREVMRPYFHYQNLMRDPKASADVNVAPSPLAEGPAEKFVRGYFQIDARGRTTTPTVNDAVPALSEPVRLPENRAFRDLVTRDLAPQLRPPATAAVRLAQTKPPATPAPAVRPVPTLPPAPAPPTATASAAPPSQNIPREFTPTQTLVVRPEVYAQNQGANQVYLSQVGGRDLRSTPAPSALTPAPPPAPITITISPLEWRTLPFAGAPAPVAVRQVQTPDGTLAQGFVIDRQAIASWLETRGDGMTAELRSDESRGATVMPHWTVLVEPSASALARASADADAAGRAFVVRFAAVGAIALLAATAVLFLITRAEQLARERSQFAAAAAHELRTPLAGLQLYGDMLAEGLGDPEKARDYARRVSEDAARLGRVVSNMLGFSQLERGDLHVEPRVGALGTAIREIAERARPAVDQAGATLEIDAVEDLVARFDRDALARIVGNLLDNAEKYGRGASNRTIRISTASRGDVVECRIEDRGPGVAETIKLFRAFSRGTAGSEGPAGLGLGLALSRSLARAMGGDLTYQPRAGGGATFVVGLRRS